MITQELLKEYFVYVDGGLKRIKATRGQSVGLMAGWVTECNGRPYKKMSFDGGTHYLHRMIYLYHFGVVPKIIDHVNGNSLDNRIENLRNATQSQNCANQIMKSNNKSGFKGVSFRKDTNKWNASIMVNGKHISLGCFESKIVAADAYIKGAKKYFNEFARFDSSEEATNRAEGRATC